MNAPFFFSTNASSALARPSHAERGTPSFFWRGYFLQLVAVAVFYLVGIFFTLRRFFVRREPAAGKAAGWKRHRHELAQGIDGFFGMLEGWGLMVVEDHLSEGEPLRAGTLLVANHPALFDALFMLRRWPDSSCVMRAGLMRNPVFRGAARACGFIPNDAGVEFVREAMARLQAKENLIIFPEGTRTLPGRPLNEFKRGFALVALKTGAPIQTILIEQEGEFMKKGSRLLLPTPLPLRVRLRRGEVFRAGERDTPEVLAGRIEEYFRRTLSKSI